MSFCFVEWDKVKTEYTEFQQVLATLERRMIIDTGCYQDETGRLLLATEAIPRGIRPSGLWAPLTFGGMTPREGQYGRIPILPEEFEDQNADVLDANHTETSWGVDSFRILFTDTVPTTVAIPGWKVIYYGSNVTLARATREDIRIAWCGIAFTEKTNPVTKLRWSLGDISYPKFDVEAKDSFNKPALIFEEGFIIPEETYFALEGFFEASGYVRAVPLGFECYRRKDLVIR